jgi:putative membrane protein
MANRELLEQTQQNKVLILCVDRDGDIEVKAGIKTPLLGRRANIDAAVALALKDPEEPDANAMFEAVRQYDRMLSEKKSDEIVEVATISGTELGGVKADRKLSAELDNILETFAATEIVLVSDGYSDEAVLPIIESRHVPISSVRRIVIKHSESIEETAAVFTKYVKLIAETPRYARVALGLPGLFMLIFAIFWIGGVTNNIDMRYYGIVIAICISVFLLLKGFGADRIVKNSYKWIREYSPPPLPMQVSNYTIIVGIVCIIISVYLGIQNISDNLASVTQDAAGVLSVLPEVIALFIKGIKVIGIVGTILVLIGRSLMLYFERDPKLLRTIALIAEVAWTTMILDCTANLLQQPRPVELTFQNLYFLHFIWSIGIGILIWVAAILLFSIVNMSSKKFFKKQEDENDQKEEEAKAEEKEIIT